MFLWVGLGNPGEEYSATRHNLGKVVLTNLCFEYIVEKNKQLKCLEYRQKRYPNVKIIFPQTYMNNSGIAVKKVCAFYNIQIDNIVIFHDDIELPVGNFDYKFGGGHRGHNGLRNIISQLDNANFHRIRLGVGRPQKQNQSVADFLLEKTSLKNMIQQEEVLELLHIKNLLGAP